MVTVLFLLVVGAVCSAALLTLGVSGLFIALGLAALFGCLLPSPVWLIRNSTTIEIGVALFAVLMIAGSVFALRAGISATPVEEHFLRINELPQFAALIGNMNGCRTGTDLAPCSGTILTLPVSSLAVIQAVGVVAMVFLAPFLVSAQKAGAIYKVATGQSKRPNLFQMLALTALGVGLGFFCLLLLLGAGRLPIDGEANGGRWLRVVQLLSYPGAFFMLWMIFLCFSLPFIQFSRRAAGR